MTVSDEFTKVDVKEQGKVGEGKKGDEKKVKAKGKGGEPQGKMEFRGNGFQMFLYFILFPLTGLLLFVPVPFVTVSIKKWFYKNLDIQAEGRKVEVSFTGSGLGLLKYWIPSLILIAAAVVLLSIGLTKSISGVKGFLVGFFLTDLGLLALAPLPWLYVGKRKYITKNLSLNLGGGGGEDIAKMVFNGKGLPLFGYSVLALLSGFILFIPLPWIIVAVVKWHARSTIVTVGNEEYHPSFSGTGGSLFWYIFGMFIASILLIFPFVFKGLVAWFARYLNVIGLGKSVEFEFKGGAGRIYLLTILEGLVILIGSILGNIVYALSKFVVALWAILTIKALGVLLLLFIVLAPQPFILTSFLKWLIKDTEIYIK